MPYHVTDKTGFSGGSCRLAVLVTVLLTLALCLPVQAQQSGESEESQQETRRTGSISEKVYRKLAEAQELADAENYAGARAILDEVKANPKLSPYETAQLYNFYGFVYYAQDRFQDSIRAYETVLKQPDIPPGLRDQTLYTLAQLHFTTENWAKAIDLVKQWMASAANPGPEPYILLGSAYYQTENYRAMIEPIERAMEIARERDVEVKEQWWLLLRVAYYELDDYKKVKDILEVLVVNWPKKEYWTQLSAMYGELDNERGQLAAYRAAYDQGLLIRSNELVQMAQLLLQAEVPYKAARVLEKGLEDGVVDKTSDNYRLLAQSWQLAAEDKKAIPALKTAAGLSSDGDLDHRLAQSYLNLSQYDNCIEAARDALRKGGLRRVDSANIVLGMCLFEQDRYEDAKKAFRAAAKDDRSRTTANQWLQFINSEQERERQLQESLKQVRSASAA
jgi:tetratricopeptide (TPR) repeat protein